jgi:hypothetical protein
MTKDNNHQNLEQGILIHKIIIRQNCQNLKHQTSSHEQQEMQALDVRKMDQKL